MAVYVYGLINSDVTAMLPQVEASVITSTSKPVSTTDITQLIEDGASKINSAVLDRSGVTPDANLDEDTHAALLALVRTYAVAQVCSMLGMQASFERYNQQWLNGYSEYLSRPQSLGDDYPASISVDIDLIDGTAESDRPVRDAGGWKSHAMKRPASASSCASTWGLRSRAACVHC
jgi:hypothetical protein